MTELKAADAVWVATALLQKAEPDGEFSVPEIVERVVTEHLTSKPRQTIYLHANQHCVANRPPNNARLRMLIETADGKRRLFHQGDPFQPERANAKAVPAREALPPQYRDLIEWYQEWSRQRGGKRHKFDGLLQLVGSGKHIWAEEHADEYVRRIRENWE